MIVLLEQYQDRQKDKTLWIGNKGTSLCGLLGSSSAIPLATSSSLIKDHYFPSFGQLLRRSVAKSGVLRSKYISLLQYYSVNFREMVSCKPNQQWFLTFTKWNIAWDYFQPLCWQGKREIAKETHSGSNFPLDLRPFRYLPSSGSLFLLFSPLPSFFFFSFFFLILVSRFYSVQILYCFFVFFYKGGGQIYWSSLIRSRRDLCSGSSKFTALWIDMLC